MKPPSRSPQQLTLFQQPKPTAQHRWPRGFTPERMQEVRQAVPTERFALSGPDSDTPARASQWDQRALSARRTQETLARSTAPASDMEGVHFRTGVPNLGARGKYFPPPPSNTGITAPSEILLAKDAGEQTVLHELGHHVDYKSDPEGFSSIPRYKVGERQGRTIVASPVLEGRAEGYSYKHLRLDRRGYRGLLPTMAYDEMFKATPHEALRATYYKAYESANGRPHPDAPKPPPPPTPEKFTPRGRNGWAVSPSQFQQGNLFDYNGDR